MWPTQPMGEITIAADVDAAHKIVNVQGPAAERVLSRGDRQVDEDRRPRELRTPRRTSYFPLMKREVWTYRYLEDNVWYMMYSFYFDPQGILRITQKTPDPLHDPDRRNLF